MNAINLLDELMTHHLTTLHYQAECERQWRTLTSHGSRSFARLVGVLIIRFGTVHAP